MVDAMATHATLLVRLESGNDSAAWSEFVDRYGELLAGFARRRGLQGADCDDLVQDVLMALVKAMPGFRYDPHKGRFRGYLKTVCMHAIQLRFANLRPGSSLSEVPSGQVAADDRAADAVWEGEWRQYHLRRALRTIAAEFNAGDRAAFQLYALEGRDVAAAAATLQMSTDQIYQAKSRILKRLSALVADQIAEEG